MDSFKIIVWNCRGAGNNRFKSNFSDMIRQHRPEIVALLETKVSLQSMGNFFHKMGFTRDISTDPDGRSGGIWILWDPTKVSVFTISINPQVIHAKIQKNGYQDWVLSALYAKPNPRLREILWEGLKEFASSINHPWAAVGDFNDTATAGESRSTGSDTNHGSRRRFTNNINDCNLVDIGSSGPRFTWTNGRQGSANIQKRLDRGLCNEEWRSLFPEGTITTLPRTYSDHNPLLLHLHGNISFIPTNKPFRFEAAWIVDPSFEAIVSNNWNGNNLTDKIVNFSQAANKWNKEVFGNIFRKKRWTLARIHGIQKAQGNVFSHNLFNLEKELISEYNKILAQEELLWFQKSRSQWIVMGERNTRYFHLSTIIRRRKAKISMLKDNNNVWIDDPVMIKDLVQNHFKDLFRYHNDTPGTCLVVNPHKKLSSEDNESLCRPITNAEIWNMAMWD
ncbi:hypothetical protein Vadar_027204 [Vaccinium darrowii]|uniref:Uncharacterized protein n=1 Tax=Vaccinium darrowii TaxID=229202 RepID=A0ACB7XCM9_9ERIC|nr:hypothetical protein Vadar_027204 [Vaccinium darrowii]